MRKRIELNRKWTTPDKIEGAWASLPPGPEKDKVNALRCLYVNMDSTLNCVSRKDFAEAHDISTRTLLRWIREFNKGGLAGYVRVIPPRRGRKRKIEKEDFRDRILTQALQAVEAAGIPATPKSLFSTAQLLGEFRYSYATFVRYLRLQRFNLWQYPADTLNAHPDQRAAP